MLKKITLALATLALAIASYYVLSRGDRLVQTGPANSNSANQVVTLPEQSKGGSIDIGIGPISPGERTSAVVYDDLTGRPKYRFEARRWEPVSNTQFDLEELEIRIYTPRGQITYISADKANVTLAQGARNNPNLKRGTLSGNVRIVIDRTTLEWRDANPELAEPDAHPDALINITLDDAQFDMDEAELTSDGGLFLDSSDVRIDRVTGLTLQWNQINNRIDSLQFRHGGYMELRRGGRAIEFALPGTERGAASAQPDDPTPKTAGPALPKFAVPRAQAMHPTSVARVSAFEAAREIRLEGGGVSTNRPLALDPAERAAVARAERLRTPAELAAAVAELREEARAGTAHATEDTKTPAADDEPVRKKIDTYQAVFNNTVVVEQIDGLRTLGKLEADKLEINFDVGSRLRGVTDARPPSRTGSVTGPDHAVNTVAAGPSPLSRADDDKTKLILTWDGPMELRPLYIAPEQQTGERFDVIATGTPVRVSSDQGDVLCTQLVYRHERRQIWLSGQAPYKVTMDVADDRRLTAQEVFFDQSRGLARIDGPGTMLDLRQNSTAAMGRRGVSIPSGSLATSPMDGDTTESRGPVQIRWTRGVDVEIGSRPVMKVNPATGLVEARQREYLRRAWFHGDVSIRRGVEQATGDELAVTFGTPQSDAELADHIQHIDIAGAVRIEGVDNLISAEHVEIEMIVTPDGRNIPRIAKADGGVTAREGTLKFAARTMRAVLAPVSGQSRFGIESFDAEGDVNVIDPGSNLKISRARSLKAVIRNGDQLARATIVGRDAETLARVRFGDVAVHGHRIEIDRDAQSIDVPGPGKVWMVTRSDFGGRRMRRPAVVKITWSTEMRLRLEQNHGVFIGDVTSQSEDFAIDCDKLTVHFAKMPPVREKKGAGIIERFYSLGLISRDKASIIPSAEQSLADTERRRPVYVLAEGNAVARRATYAPAGADGRPGRLLDRMRIAGTQIGADLRRRQVSVPSGGSLTIEDYAFDLSPSRRLARSSARTGPLMSSVRSDGPSQTAIQWDNAMDFFLDRSLVVFDKNVRMVHRSGRQMVQKEALARAMGLDGESLPLGAGRRTDLTCGNLLLQFQEDQSGDTPREVGSAVRATDLERLIARGAVYLKDGTKSLMGEQLQYLRETNEVVLEGSDSLEARIIDESENRYSVMKQRILIWNRETNRIEAPNPRFHVGRR